MNNEFYVYAQCSQWFSKWESGVYFGGGVAKSCAPPLWNLALDAAILKWGTQAASIQESILSREFHLT